MKWTPPDTDFVLPILTILPKKHVGYNEVMNLSTLKSLIEKLADDGFTTAQEKLIALALAILDEGIQKCDIIETLNLGKKLCLDILKSFKEKQIVETFGRRAVFYRKSRYLKVSPEYREVSPQYPEVSPEYREVSPVH